MKIRVRCAGCGMQSRSLILGDGESGMAFCARCNRVANSWRSRWRPLDPPRCRECGPSGHLRPLGTCDPSAAPHCGVGDFFCPCCGWNPLEIELEAMVSFDFPRVAPHSTVHCRVMTGPVGGVCQALMLPNTVLRLSGAEASHLHWWCVAELEDDIAKARFVAPIVDSGVTGLEQLEIPELLRLDLAELQRALSQEQPQARAVWNFLASRLPLVLTQSKVCLNLVEGDWVGIAKLLYEHPSSLSGLSHLWDSQSKEWLASPPASLGLDFGGGEVLWLQPPWEGNRHGVAYAERIFDYRAGLRGLVVRDRESRIVNRVPPPLPVPPSQPELDLSTAQDLAHAGEAEAQYQLGLELESGGTLERDRGGAMTWFSKAARQGHGKAQWKLGMAYLEGIPLVVGCEPDLALEWLKKAADQRVPEALFALGELYSQGLGVEPNLTLARGYYGSAGVQGHELGMLKAGRMHLHGEGDYASTADGVHHLSRAGDLGVVEAELELAHYYQRQGDPERARMWFRRAAERGSLEAARYL